MPDSNPNPTRPARQRAAVVTVSDRCSSGEARDLSGPLAAQLLGALGLDVSPVIVVPDGVRPVRSAIEDAVAAGHRLVLTTGGTGVSPRDLTPEATESLLEMHLDGLAEAIRRRGAEHVPTALLSRGLVGVMGRGAGASVVVNAPGSPGGVRDAVAVIGPMLEHLFAQLAGADHPSGH
ncbi:molybdenum cofactor synthesis domain-containing protein [Propionibacterium cyclohexanicum]|uniref:Molybdenum cofactor synthesis domain-containing protein n=1 Tax=Propionibacterium cyclohexanicum TaxID=64702 RepID=A0A1H9U1Y6_9ACTN|nr:MogA/MoaB family molybdenum cofactor biosynthesis protein [Propionibacterium cyclohexanicum]SES03292.1 molybdenum cofactor synthesis domain-containing protein [Propionibacterium cyclohexanicum]